MRTIACGFILVWLGAGWLRASEVRGLWVDAFGPGLHTSQQVTQLVEHCRKYHFNAVFVQVRKRGDAYYTPQSPNTEPRAAELSGKFDPLAELLKQCHRGEKRIEVHAWLVAYFVWAWHKPPPQPGHVFNRHPELLTRDSIGQKQVGNGYYLDPGHPGTGDWLLTVARDVVSRYDVDGLHWDYLRYPNQDSGYNPVALQRYKAEFNVAENPEQSDARFILWRQRQIGDFLRWSTAELLQLKPNLVVSAAVFSNYTDSRDHRFANWTDWLRQGVLDVAIPMDFSPDNKAVFNPRADFAATNQGNRAIYLGQGSYMNTVENTLAQLASARKGFPGTVLYSYRNPALPPAAPAKHRKPPKAKTAEFIVDNTEAEVMGNWQAGDYGEAHGDDYYYKGSGDGSAFVRFAPSLPKPGRYGVYEWHVAGRNRAVAAPIEIHHAEGVATRTINQQQNDAKWNLLGTFRFEPGQPAEVRVTDAFAAARQVVVADAVRFVLLPDDETARAELLAELEPEPPATVTLDRDRIFSTLRDRHQPSWTSAPPLPWKQQPTTGIVKGTVVNSKDTQPVYNARVTLQTQPPRIQQTDASGRFAFYDVPPGAWKVSVESHPGRPNEAKVKAGDIATVDFNLESGPPPK